MKYSKLLKTSLENHEVTLGITALCQLFEKCSEMPNLWGPKMAPVLFGLSLNAEDYQRKIHNINGVIAAYLPKRKKKEEEDGY